MVTLDINSEKTGEMQVDLKITVTDTGIGVPLSDFDTIFHDFKQSSKDNNNNSSGTGLGLSITKKLIDVMGGKISLENNKGAGSKFIVVLPGLEIATDYMETSKIETSDQIETKTVTMAEVIEKPTDIGNLMGRDTMKKLVNDYQEKWDEVVRNNVINEISDFSDELLDFAYSHQEKQLIEFCKSLHIYTDNFDIDHLNSYMSILDTVFKSNPR